MDHGFSHGGRAGNPPDERLAVEQYFLGRGAIDKRADRLAAFAAIPGGDGDERERLANAQLELAQERGRVPDESALPEWVMIAELMSRHHWTERQILEDLSQGYIRRLYFLESIKAKAEEQDYKAKERHARISSARGLGMAQTHR